jgi:predicted transcriptional regulator
MAAKKVSETPELMRKRINEAVAMDAELDGVDVRVFLYLSAAGAFDEHVHVPQIQLAMMLRRRKEHISRAIRNLTENGVIVPSEKGTRGSEWRINPDYGK